MVEINESKETKTLVIENVLQHLNIIKIPLNVTKCKHEGQGREGIKKFVKEFIEAFQLRDPSSTAYITVGLMMESMVKFLTLFKEFFN